MSEQTNAPMLPPPSGVSEWMTVWREALTRPSEETFARIARSPNAKSTTALLWIFLGSLVNFFLASLVQGAIFRRMMQNSDFGGLEGFPAGAGGGLVGAICGAPIGAVISVALFALVVGVVQFIAKMFGGRGTFDQLAYAIAAIVAPFYLVSAILTLLSAIPTVGFCFGLLGLLAGLYVLVLEVMAVKGVNQFGWGPAIGSLLIPVIAVACCFAVVVGALFSVFAQQFPEIFNSIMTPGP